MANITVIVPAHNAEDVLPRCLEAIQSSTPSPGELLVVDDHSSDGTVEIARKFGAALLSTESQSGPGAARNLAAEQAAGELLMFVDSDVVIRPDTLARMASHFERDPAVAAVFGSYDDDPGEKDFMSQYKNLQHHFVHQRGSEDASTFWAGCGAVRRDVFLQLGGFDIVKYPRPAIEDIELGARIRRLGHKIVLDKSVQVKHLKRWTFIGLLRTDIFCRAVPWTKLLLTQPEMTTDLNLKGSDRLSAALTCLLVALLPAAVLFPILTLAMGVCLVLILLLNRDFYGFFLRKRGFLFMLRVIPMHLLYYLYSAAAFLLCWLQVRLRPPG